MKIRRASSHQCPICKTWFKGKGSKNRARNCIQLGEPDFLYNSGTKVRINSGSGAGNTEYFVIGGRYTRRVVREDGNVKRAYHIKRYRLQPVGSRRIRWPWPTESQLVVVR